MKSNEIAKLAGVSVRTLRHYHAIGLLPEPPRSENGYRDYGAEDLVRLLRIKRLTSLGFSLARIDEALDEMDRNLADAAGPNADTALDELDRELALQIERLEEQRRTIALLKQEQLDPDLPVRFARAVKTLIGDVYETMPVTNADRQALLLAGHLYTEKETAELERTAAAIAEQGLSDRLQAIQERFNDMPEAISRDEADELVAEAVELLEPIIDCFDPANWDSSATPDAYAFVDKLIRDELNEAQTYVQDQLEAKMQARILARQGERERAASTNPPREA